MNKKRIRISLLIIIAIFFIIALVMFINSFQKLNRTPISTNYVYDNVHNPNVTHPITMESININVLAGGTAVFGIKILNTLNETVNISILHQENSDCFNENDQEQSLLELPYNQIDLINPEEIIESAGIIRTGGTILEEKNQTVECTFEVKLNGKTSNLTFSESITIYSR